MTGEWEACGLLVLSQTEKEVQLLLRFSLMTTTVFRYWSLFTWIKKASYMS